MIAVLGPTRIGGSVIRSRAQRVLLATLVLERGRVTSAARLADLIWGDELPANWNAALHSHVSRLRRILPDDVEIVADGVGYRLVLGPEAGLDVHVLETAHSTATDARDHGEQMRRCDRGLAVVGGEPFADLDDPDALAARARIDELIRSLHDLRIESLIALARDDDAIAELEALRATDPHRESTVERLMHVLMRTGRKRRALAVYADLRERLVDELGLDPSAELRQIRDSIVTETYEPPPPYRRTDDSRGDVPRGATIPAPGGDELLGRREELDRVSELLGSPGVVTVVGPGGVGKTRLALQIARRSSTTFDRVDVVELAGLTDEAALPEAIASELGLPAQIGTTTTSRIAAALRSGRRLLVLDNCEHLVDRVAAFVEELRRGRGSVHVLATSREPLHVDDETVVRLAPLTDDDGIELLCRRIEQRGRDRPIGEEAHQLLGRVVGAVDGLPLGIELAAAYCDTMTLGEIADALTEPLELAHRGRRSGADRHRSLRSLIEWSARDLDEVQRHAFAHTSVFAGPFTADALAAVADLPPRVALQALADLVDRSLVVSAEGPGDRMLHTTMSTVDAFAGELLSSGHLDAAEARHGDWVVDLTTEAAASLRGWRRAEHIDLVDVHLADLRLAHQRFVAAPDAERGVRFAASLHYLATFSMHAELFAWIAEAADRFGTSNVAGVPSVLASAGVGAWEGGDMDRSRGLADASAASTAPSLGIGIGAPELLADLAGFAGDNVEAIRLFAEGLEAARAEQNECRLFGDLADRAIHLGYEGDIAAALASVQEANDLIAGNGPLTARAWVSYVEGEALAETDPVAAKTALRRSVDDATAAGADFIIGVARLTLAGLEVRTGGLDAARTELHALLTQWQQAGAHLQQWITLRTVLSLLVARGERDVAARTLGLLVSDRNPADIGGADAVRVEAERLALLESVPSDVFSEWLDRDIDDVVADLLVTLE